mmetsp:Transcript_377/g.800  ORF Transcript_377/g.800 Transcript_377/m.800 type:complete len:309 (-) Transcript_377:2728-3654(-)
MNKPAQPNKTNANKRRSKYEEPEFPVKPVTIQAIKPPRGTMNHSYRDFSQVPPHKNYVQPTEIKDMTFSQKVHHILSNPENEKWISWMPHGRSFKVHVPVMFETQVCPKYFNHKRYSSFLRELNNYGFKHISKGTDRNSYYHEFMLKGRPHLCQYMPPCKDARRLVADPENEPNFYRICRQYPLDGSAPFVEDAADDLPHAKRIRSDSVTKMPKGIALGANALAGLAALGVSSPAPVKGSQSQQLNSGAAPASNQAAALLSILEAQNQKRKEEEQQRAMLAAALLQHQGAAPSAGHNLAAVLGMLGQQ